MTTIPMRSFRLYTGASPSLAGFSLRSLLGVRSPGGHSRATLRAHARTQAEALALVHAAALADQRIAPRGVLADARGLAASDPAIAEADYRNSYRVAGWLIAAVVTSSLWAAVIAVFVRVLGAF